MAVTTTVTSRVEYMRDGDSLGNCLLESENYQDYRTMTKNTKTDDLLLIRAWAGDNISSACKIVSTTIQNLSVRIRTTSNGTVGVYDEYTCFCRFGVYAGSVSGTAFTGSAVYAANLETVTKDNKSDYVNIYGVRTIDWSEKGMAAKDSYIGINIQLSTDISLSTTKRRIYVKDVILSATRTRACYVTFKGEGVTEITTMYDYDTIPSYGSEPTRAGYKFAGWLSSDDGQVYTGTLPTAYEQDVTYTAEWKVDEYTITATAGEGGTVTGSGTYSYGSTATLKAVSNTGYKFVKWSDGVTTATRTVTVTGNATYTAVFQEMLYKIVIDNGDDDVVAEYDVRVGANFTLTNELIFGGLVMFYPGFTGVNVPGINTNYHFNGFEDWNSITASNGQTFTGEQFDAPFYANTYSDLYKAYGYNKQSLVNHYANYGINEGRKGVSANGARGVYPDGATVNFPANEGETVTLLNQWGSLAKITLPTIARECYKFLGWYTDLKGGTRVGGAGDEYQPTNQTTALYAQWEADPPKISDVQVIYGGKVVSSTNKVPAGQSYIVKCKLE